MADDPTARPDFLRMARDMAASGAFTAHSEITLFLSHYPGFEAAAEWFADPLFQSQLNQLCAEAVQKRAAKDSEPEEA
jgi:hypothetical protein